MIVAFFALWVSSRVASAQGDVGPFAVAGSPENFYDVLNPVPLLGESRVLFILINYDPTLALDDPHPLPMTVTGAQLDNSPIEFLTKEDLYDLVFDDRYPGPFAHETLNDWFREVSNDRFRIVGDVVGYCTLDIDMYPRPSSFPDPQEFLDFRYESETQALQCARDRGFNVDILNVEPSIEHPIGLQVLGDYDVVAFVGTWLGYTRAGPPVVWYDDEESLSWYIWIHELGHVYRYYHAGAWECGAYTIHPPASAPACLTMFGPLSSEYGDISSVMGSSLTPGHFGARFDPDQEIMAATSGSYRLTPLETATGPKLLRVPRTVEGGFFLLCRF